MKGITGRENDQNIREHRKEGEGTVLERPLLHIDYNFKLVSVKTNVKSLVSGDPGHGKCALWTTAEI